MPWGVFLLLLTLPAPWELRLPPLGWAQVLAASCGLGRGEAGVRGAPACRRVLPAGVGAVQRDVGVGARCGGTLCSARATRCPAQRACRSPRPLPAARWLPSPSDCLEVRE